MIFKKISANSTKVSVQFNYNKKALLLVLKLIQNLKIFM